MKKRWILLGVLVIGTAAACVDGGTEETKENEKAPIVEEKEDNKTEVTIEEPKKEEPAKTEEPQIVESMEEQNLRKAAEDYLSLLSFSRIGLIEQLEYEGYNKDLATKIVDSMNIDFNEQAVITAQNYLDLMSFSKSGLIEQLEYEGFTPEQAQHGVNTVYQ